MARELDAWLKFRISSAQLQRWQAEAAQQGIPLSALVRAALLGRAVHRVPELNQQAWVQLAAASANLNQLVHRLNSAHQMGGDSLLTTAREEAKSIFDSLQGFRTSLICASLGKDLQA